jgi:hypothetical protein
VGGVEKKAGEQSAYEAGAQEDASEGTGFVVCVSAGGEELTDQGEKGVKEP